MTRALLPSDQHAECAALFSHKIMTAKTKFVISYSASRGDRKELVSSSLKYVLRHLKHGNNAASNASPTHFKHFLHEFWHNGPAYVVDKSSI